MHRITQLTGFSRECVHGRAQKAGFANLRIEKLNVLDFPAL